MRGVFMSATDQVCEPDNIFTMEINGTKHNIKVFFDGKETINDIIAKRIKKELDPDFPRGEKG